MARVRDQFRKAVEEAKANRFRTAENAKTLVAIKCALVEVSVYLTNNKDSVIPMSYDMVQQLFGTIDKKKAEEVLNYAIQTCREEGAP